MACGTLFLFVEHLHCFLQSSKTMQKCLLAIVIRPGHEANTRPGTLLGVTMCVYVSVCI